MKCNQQSCEEVATWRVFWPGKPPLPMCDKDKDRALGVGQVLGCYIYAEPLLPAQAAQD